MAECALGGEPIQDTALICHPCAAKRERWWREAAALWPELDTTITRQDRTGDPTPRAGRPAPPEPIRPTSDPSDDHQTGYATGLPYAESASDVAWVVRNTVTTWARVICETVRADPPAATDDLLRWVAGRVDWLRYEPYAAEAFEELDYAARLVARAVDRPLQRVDAGMCATQLDDGSRCQQWLTAPAAAEVIRCRACGTTHYTTDRHRAMLRQARDHRGNAHECARWLSRLGLPTTAAMVRGLAHRRRILADAHGRYRLGDVEDCRRETMEREVA